MKLNAPTSVSLIVKLFLSLCCLIFLAACSTDSLAKRKQTFASAYAALTPEERQLVDQGKIKVGMSEAAVRIAWGEPDQTLQSEDALGHVTVWLYQGTTMVEHQYWSQRRGIRGYPESSVERYYDPHDFVSAEVTLQNGKVQKWRTLPRPLQ